jgi:hypothetical protein
VKPYDELRASALRTLIPPQNDAYDAVLDDAESNPHDAALGILRELGGADEIVWRNECEAYGYYFEPDEFREIVEHLEDDELVRVHYEDPLWAIERASEDGWDDYPDFYAGAATYEAADM